MAIVRANQDILTNKGLTVAHKGEAGEAVPGAVPYDTAHYGKVLVRFADKQRAYWCGPEQLTFPHNVDIPSYVAQPVDFDPFKGAPRLPQSPATNYHFGQNLRLCRQARKLTQTQLGQAMSRFGLKAAQATICYREGRQYSPNGKFVEAAARVLKVPAWVFFVDIKDCEVLTGVRGFLGQMSSSICEARNEHTG